MKKILGERLRELRNERNLSLRTLAKLLGGVSAPHLSDLELGRRVPSDRIIMKLARFYQVTPSELKALEIRPPVREVKWLVQQYPTFAAALRKMGEKP